jgi:exopolysaccharide biosynthesis polyprenyl glycosylphosphotransferase
MTPPPAASHVEQPAELTLAPRPEELATRALTLVLGKRGWWHIRLLVDVVVICLASSAAAFAAPIAGSPGTRWLAVSFLLLTLAMLYARRNPDDRLAASTFDTSAHVLGSVSLAAMMTIAAGSILGGAHPVGLALRLWLFASVYLVLARVVLLSIRNQALRSGALATPTLIVGAGMVGEHLVRRLTDDRRYGLRPVGFLDANPLPTTSFGSSSVPMLGAPERLAEALQSTGARHVILAFSAEPDHVLVEKVKECERLGVGVSLVPRLFESISQRAVLDHVGGLPLVSLRPTDPRGWQFAAKHSLDRIIALCTLIVLAPLLGAIALGVRLSSGGPILFRQRRVGRDGHVFDLLKFRTMREFPSAEPLFQLPSGCAPGGVEGEDRRTPFGRRLRDTSLDELPQLINVLRGDMSLIGPRPERPEYVQRFTTEINHYDDRHRVKSGITGWAQVNGLRGQTSISDRVEWDNYYIQNWSLRLDLRIVALTLAEMLRSRDSANSRPGRSKAAGPAELNSARQDSSTI